MIKYQKTILLILICSWFVSVGVNQANALDYYCEKITLHEGLLTLESQETRYFNFSVKSLDNFLKMNISSPDNPIIYDVINESLYQEYTNPANQPIYEEYYPQGYWYHNHIKNVTVFASPSVVFGLWLWKLGSCYYVVYNPANITISASFELIFVEIYDYTTTTETSEPSTKQTTEFVSLSVLALALLSVYAIKRSRNKK